jgi:hypothetical protein
VDPTVLAKGGGLTLVFAALIGAIPWAPAVLSPIICFLVAGGAGCAAAFRILLLGLSRGSQTENGGVRVLTYGMVLVAVRLCVAAVVLGIHAMVSKS